MKVLHIISSLHMGGAEKLLVDLLPRFKQNGIDVDLLVFDGEDTPFKRELKSCGINVFELSERGYVYNPKYIFQLIPYLNKYDIIHTHNTAPQLFAAIGSLFCSASIVTTEHTASNRRRGWKWYKPIDRWMYTRYKKIICISDKAEYNLRQHLRKDLSTICTIYNGINIKAFAEAQPDDEFCRTYKNCIRLIMVARFAPAKDQKTVMHAVALLSSEYHLFFVGDGDKKVECMGVAQELGISDRVHFLGIRTDVPKLFKSCDISILSSHWEGMPISAIEAMAAGRPLIASDVDGIHETVYGAGILFEHENAQELAVHIRKLSTDAELYRETVNKCIAKAQQFDISIMAEKYESIYHDVLDN